MNTSSIVSQKAHTALVQRLLATQDPEAARHADATRRHEHERLRLALSQSQGVRDAASQHHTSLLFARRSDTATALVESQAKLDVAEAEVAKSAEAVASFEAAEQMRKQGPIGEIVMLLTIAHDEERAARIAAEARIAALEKAVGISSASPAATKP